MAALVGRVRLPEPGSHFGAVALAAEPERLAPKCSSIEAAAAHLPHRLFQGLLARLVEEHPGIGSDRLERPSLPERDGGTPAGESLQGRDAKVLLVRLNQRAAGAVGLPELLLRNPLLEANGRSRDRSKPLEIGPRSDDAEPGSHPVRRADREVHALVGNERGDGEERSVGARLGIAGSEELGVHRRVDDERGTPVVLPDPVADVEGVPDEEVHPVRAQAIPLPESMRDRASHPALDGARASRREILRGQIPEIADRGVAVAHVKGVGPGEDSLRRAMADRHDEVVSAQVEGLDGLRIGGDVPAVAAPPQGQLRDPGLVDAVRFDGLGESPLPVHEGVDLRGGKHLAQHLEAFFAAPHAGEPVVDQRDAKRIEGLGRKCRGRRAHEAGAGDSASRRSAASRSRSTVRSRPKSRITSKMPGLTFFPVSAMRAGMITSPAFTPSEAASPRVAFAMGSCSKGCVSCNTVASFFSLAAAYGLARSSAQGSGSGSTRSTKRYAAYSRNWRGRFKRSPTASTARSRNRRSRSAGFSGVPVAFKCAATMSARTDNGSARKYSPFIQSSFS